MEVLSVAAVQTKLLPIQDVYCCTLRDRLLKDLDSAICTPTVV